MKTVRLFFIEAPEGYLNTSFELLYQIRNITFEPNPNLFYIFRDDDYFANVKVLRYLIEELDTNSITILTNDDRMLANFRINELDSMYFWNYRLQKFINSKNFYPNIRKENNIENMWRRRVFPEAYYRLEGNKNGK